MIMKANEPVSLKELLNPRPPARQDMVESVPPPEMTPVEAPQLMPRPGDVGFPGRTLDGNNYMAPLSPRAVLPRWVRVVCYIIVLLNFSALTLWLLANLLDIHPI